MAGTMAYAHTIRELGSAAVASTGYGEAAHKAIKPWINLTNRHHETFLGQVCIPTAPAGNCAPVAPCNNNNVINLLRICTALHTLGPQRDVCTDGCRSGRCCCCLGMLMLQYSQSVHWGAHASRGSDKQWLLLLQMIRGHARNTTALDLAAAYREQEQAEDEPALRGLVCFCKDTVEVRA